jgi:hypothetical protein
MRRLMLLTTPNRLGPMVSTITNVRLRNAAGGWAL